MGTNWKIVAVLITVGIIGAGAYVAYDKGYIPIGMPIEEPPGNFEKYDGDIGSLDEPDGTIPDYASDLDWFYDTLSKIPGIEKINYEVFLTDSSESEVYNNYKNKLEAKGYTEHPDYSGTTFNEDGYSIEVYAFVEGLTGVVFATTQLDGKTGVFYSTGNVMDYISIFEWAQGNL